MAKRSSWPTLVLTAAGVFIGSYWMVYGFTTVMNQPHLSWWRSLLPLAPGAVVWLMVLLARRAPLPYGTGLAALGVMAFFFSWPRGPILPAALLGGPILLIGLGFILLRKKFEADAA